MGAVDKNRLEKISYFVVVLMFLLAAWLRLGTILITVLFAYFALRKFRMNQRKWVSIVLFFILITVIGYGFWIFAHQAMRALPTIFEKSIPAMVDYANAHG